MNYDLKKVLARRPAHVIEKLGESCPICLVNSRDVLAAIKDRQGMIMACNTRIKHVVPGIMRAATELDAVVAFELAKSEGHIDGGYTGQDPQTYFETIIGYADQVGFRMPFFIHGDHITVKKNTPEEIGEAQKLIAAELAAGYTSFAIDASFNPIPVNVELTTKLAQPILAAGLGLEVEVGEIGSTGQKAQVTTVAEATEFISGLSAKRIKADMLAINNGSKHGNYLEGEEISIDLERTGQIFEAVKGYGVVIAQHGITGTPTHLLHRFVDYGIRKGNVGTQWQNIAHDGLPADLMAEMRAWAKEKGKDIKMATKPFKAKIDGIGQQFRQQIADRAYEEAKLLIKAFRAEGTASAVFSHLGR